MITGKTIAMNAENKQSSIAFVIGASSVGTLIEWYDFYHLEHWFLVD